MSKPHARGFDLPAKGLGLKSDTPRLVPWAGVGEWEQVLHGFFSCDPAARTAALACVDAWRSRDRVPLAVEVNAFAHMHTCMYHADPRAVHAVYTQPGPRAVV